jgi:hypothetical protein
MMEHRADQIAGAFERFVEAIRILQSSKQSLRSRKFRFFCFCVFAIHKNSILPISFFSIFDLVIAAPPPLPRPGGVS